jgi:hypothetical protein
MPGQVRLENRIVAVFQDPIIKQMSMSIVYLLSNPGMPGLVKIGKTESEDTSVRLLSLYTTGVPFPFHLEFACRVPNPAEVEDAMHQAFAPNRVNPRREFFKIDPEQAIAILKLLHVQDITQEVADQQASTVDSVDEEAAKQYRNRRQNLNFEEMGIPVGAVLTFTKKDASVTVTGPKKVRLNGEEGGEEMSLTAATRLLLGLDYSVAPGKYWLFKGRPFNDIYDDTYV